MPRRTFGCLVLSLASLVACSDPTIVGAPGESAPYRFGADLSVFVDASRVQRQYGPAVKIGNGVVRTYVLRDKSTDAPLEVGVAMSESSMDGLPAPAPAPAATAATAARNEDHGDHDGNQTGGQKGGHGASHGHEMSLINLLEMPSKNPTPYQFVELDWNPGGHEPAGVYDLPHFDFHFWTVSREVRSSIVPTDPRYAQNAANLPAPEFRAPFYLDGATAAGAPAGAVAVPLMGLHWLDVRSPELQRLTGHPEAYKPFTTTFLYGSWNGQFVFDEPMITRAYIMAKRDASDPAVRDEIIPVSTPQRSTPAGFYAGAYRIAYDAGAREYRIALTQLARRQ
jgi:hypothetical protein